MARLPKHYLREALAIKRELDARSEESNWDRRNQYTGEMYCVHGVNIGTWDGADLMCGACESGWSPYEYALYCAYDMWRADRKSVMTKVLYAALDLLKDEPEDLFTSAEYMEMYNGINGLAPEANPTFRRGRARRAG